MSLINDALRKAQNQHTSAPGLGDGSTAGNPSVNYTGRSTPYGLIIGLSLCIFILIGLVAGLATLLFNKNTNPPVQQSSTPAELATPVPESTTEPDKNEQIFVETIAPESQQSAPKPTGPMATKVETPPAVTIPPDPKIIDWLEQSVISGLRITNSSSKVILNNKAYTPGETVNMELGLKVLAIEENRILLIDANSVEYVKLL